MVFEDEIENEEEITDEEVAGTVDPFLDDEWTEDDEDEEFLDDGFDSGDLDDELDDLEDDDDDDE